MSEDLAGLAISAIRRIVRVGDLEMIQAVLSARKLDIVSSPRMKSTGRSGMLPKPPAPKSTLDPAHKRDPLYLAYIASNKEILSWMKQNHARRRSEAPLDLQRAFGKAQKEWLSKRLTYKLNLKVCPKSDLPETNDKAVKVYDREAIIEGLVPDGSLPAYASRDT